MEAALEATKVGSKALDQTIEVERNLGEYRGEKNGPMVIFVAGAHGNEPAGIFAVRQVLGKLEKLNPAFKGSMVALTGNLSALSNNVRFIEKDMNRLWLYEKITCPIDRLLEDNKLTQDEREYVQLFCELKKHIHQGNPPFYIVDLHTTSSVSAPYFAIGDTMRNRKFAIKFPVPITLGLEEQLHGTMMNYLNDMGIVATIFEGGQHDSISAIENIEACIWLTLVQAGCVQPRDIPDFDKFFKRLEKAARGKRKLLEVRYRYAIKEGEDFKMKPGYENFRKIKKGETIAENQYGPVKAEESGRIFMPLYQKQGNDGYFIVKEFNPFWLRISEVIRKLGLHKAIPWLPGFKKHSTDENTLLINLKVARWYVVEFMHLMGYRKDKIVNNKLVVSKRKYDLRNPDKQELISNFE
jgi:succinylglutamate desuccinylase